MYPQLWELPIADLSKEPVNVDNGYTTATYRLNPSSVSIENIDSANITAVRIIPYLVAFLVGIAVFRTSGAMDMLVSGIGYIVGLFGVDTSLGQNELIQRTGGRRKTIMFQKQQ